METASKPEDVGAYDDSDDFGEYIPPVKESFEDGSCKREEDHPDGEKSQPPKQYACRIRHCVRVKTQMVNIKSAWSCDVSIRIGIDLYDFSIIESLFIVEKI